MLRRPFANTRLNLAILWELMLLVVIIYLPFLHESFSTVSLPLIGWLSIIGLGLSVFSVLELIRWLERRGITIIALAAGVYSEQTNRR